jgi:hypothetical protein
MNETLDYKWLAAYFEGEGCVRYAIIPPRVYKSRTYKSRAYLRIYIGSSNGWILQEIKLKFGGCLFSDKFNGRTYWHWSTGSKKAMEICKGIQPYLFDACEKKRQIDFAIKVGVSATLEQAKILSEMKTHHHNKEEIQELELEEEKEEKRLKLVK